MIAMAWACFSKWRLGEKNELHEVEKVRQRNRPGNMKNVLLICTEAKTGWYYDRR